MSTPRPPSEFPPDWSQLRPARLWHHFREITRIPRSSGNEFAVGEYILKWAIENRHTAAREKSTGNIIVRLEPTSGRKWAPGVILQSHLDMVCERDGDSLYDPEEGRIRVVREDPHWVAADGTTLGADNGIGVATMLAVAEAEEFMVRGPVLLVFTVEEETSLRGAAELNPSWITPDFHFMINLDTEELDTICLGSAGGCDVQIDAPALETPVEDFWPQYDVEVGGLLGGHSGMDIREGRINAIKYLTGLLHDLHRVTGAGFRICELRGGGRTNALPREASARLAMNPSTSQWREGELESMLRRLHTQRLTERNLIGGSIARGDADPVVHVTPVGQRSLVALDTACSEMLLRFLRQMPHGALTAQFDAVRNEEPAHSDVKADAAQQLKHGELLGSVRASCNLATVRFIKGTDGTRIVTVVSCRSTDEQELDDVVNLAVGARIRMASRKPTLAQSLRYAISVYNGATVEVKDRYPAWPAARDSYLTGLVAAAHERVCDSKPKLVTIHAGLECGLFAQTHRHLDIVSIGPTIQYVHRPGERVDVESVGKFWTILSKTLDGIWRIDRRDFTYLQRRDRFFSSREKRRITG